MCDFDKTLNEKGPRDAIINLEETHQKVQEAILSVKCSFPILLQFESLLYLQSSYSLHPNTHTHTHNDNNTINIPSSVNIHSLRVNICYQRILYHNRRGGYVQRTLTEKVYFHQRGAIFFVV